jgi:hypothetical protein
MQSVHNPQRSLSEPGVGSIEVEGFERVTSTHAKITIKGHTLQLSNLELESYKKLRQKFLAAGIALNPNIKQAEWFKKFSQLLENTPIAYPTTKNGGAIVEQRVQEALAEAISQGQPGFAGGWISSAAFDELLKRRRLSVALNRRKELLYTLGYIWLHIFPTVG